MVLKKKQNKAKSLGIGIRKFRRKVLSLSQILATRKTNKTKNGQTDKNQNLSRNTSFDKKNGQTNRRTSFDKKNGQTYRSQNANKGKIFDKKKNIDKNKKQKPIQSIQPIQPIIPPKSLIILLKKKPAKAVYNRRIIDYKHCGLLQRYIGLGGKILPRRQTKLSAKQQRFVATTIKTARVMGLLPFVSKERGFFR